MGWEELALCIFHYFFFFVFVGEFDLMFDFELEQKIVDFFWNCGQMWGPKTRAKRAEF